ncbi:uncharacterized protein LOC128235697 [Mya arenaria]|uniref:uncharacterized protein LOC128235697 n=1 Tax=Mya arenaria TaxID=6604 RepID=UPI0022E254B6|nr:uncharacterized protein LOC128235697 [Mya arenaria]
MDGPKAIRYSENGSFFLEWKASIEYNRSDFYAGCSKNPAIRSRLLSLNVKEILGKCGALVILSPIVRGADVKLGYFPSDHSIQQTRTWKANIQDIELRENSYEEEIVSEYLYILTIFNFEDRDEGTYILCCNSDGHTDSVQLHISEPPSYPVLGPKSVDFKTTDCIYVYGDSDIYCQTENGTEPVQVALLLGQDSYVLAESKLDNGLYLFSNIYQQMAGLSRSDVTCQVSNAAIEKPFEVHGIRKVAHPF